MKRLRYFLKEYKLFSLALVAFLLALILKLNKDSTAANWVLGVVSILEVLPVIRLMWLDIRTGTYGIDVLAITAIVASVALNQDWAAIVVVLMLTGGESLEDYANERAKTELNSLLKLAPQTAIIIKKGKEQTIKVSEIRIGDKLVIKAGEIVPVDSIILEGKASFDEASLTGESLPVNKSENDSLLSGSVNLDGLIQAKALRSAEDSQYQQIIKLVRGAAASKAPFVRLADRYSIPFTIASFGLAITVWVISGHAIRFLEIIIVATPCPLLLAAPVALISGMSRANRLGIIIKNGASLEKLAEARTFAFDKTGILTKGNLSVESVKSYNGFDKDDVLKLAASLEQGSSHVVAAAIVSNAKLKQVKLEKAKQVKEIAGQGLQATIKGALINVGSQSFLKSNGVKIPSALDIKKINNAVVYVSRDNELVGAILLSDEIRSNARSTIKKISRLGIKNILMVTGDNQLSANRVAKEVGIKKINADCLPSDKLKIVSEVSKRPLVFVGDGVNDAPALTSADVGIALGVYGSTTASESADMVIMLDDIGRVADAYEIAKRTFQIAKQSILVGIGLSLILMIIFASGKLQPLYGAVLQEVVDVVVIFNALRAHRIKLSQVG